MFDIQITTSVSRWSYHNPTSNVVINEDKRSIYENRKKRKQLRLDFNE